MTTIEEILKTETPKPTQTQQSEKGDQNNPQPSSSDSAQGDNSNNSALVESKETSKPTKTYVELLEELYPKPDAKKLRDDAKKARTRNIISALGDGLSALSNLYYTTKGAPNMLDGKNTLSEASQARYDKLIQDYKDNLEKYRQGRLKAEQMDKEWDYRTERDKVGDEQWDKSHQLNLDKFEHQKERDKVGDDRYEAEQEHRAEREQKADEQAKQTQDNWQKTFDENIRQFNERMKNASRKKRTTSKKKNEDAEKITFINKDGSTISIDKEMWDNEYANIFDAYQEGMAHDLSKPYTWSSSEVYKTNKEGYKKGKHVLNKEKAKEIISKDWYNSPSFIEYLQNLSEQSASDDYEYEYDEDFSQYEVTSDDDFSQYEVNK